MEEQIFMDRQGMALCGVEDGHYMSIERAEQLRASGAYLELDAKGWVWIYIGRGRREMQGDFS